MKADKGEILHLSQAALHKASPGKNYVQAVDGKQKYAIAVLEKGNVEHASFDLFFRAGHCGFLNEGASEVHLTGYFEPDGMEEDEEEEEEEDTKRSRK